MSRIAVALVLVAGAATGAWAVILHRQELLLILVDGSTTLVAFVDRRPAVAMIAFVALYTAYVGIGIPVSFVLTIAGAYLFEWHLGLALSTLGALCGAVVLHGLTRFALTPFAERIVGHRLQTISDGFNENAVSYMLFLRLVTLFPFFVVNLAAGLLRVPLRIFIPTTLFGMMPSIVAFTLLGRGVDVVLTRATADLAACRMNAGAVCPVSFNGLDLLQPETFVASGILGVLALVPVILKWQSRKKIAVATVPVQK